MNENVYGFPICAFPQFFITWLTFYIVELNNKFSNFNKAATYHVCRLQIIGQLCYVSSTHSMIKGIIIMLVLSSKTIHIYLTFSHTSLCSLFMYFNNVWIKNYTGRYVLFYCYYVAQCTCSCICGTKNSNVSDKKTDMKCAAFSCRQHLN